MHNRKKLDRPLNQNELKAIQEKSTMYKTLVDLIFAKRKNKEYTQETLSLITKMLVLNPDFYSLWNFRREILITLEPKLSEPAKVSDETLLQIELHTTAEAIRRNPKSYGAWHHRLWVVDHFEVDYKNELALCKEFLKADQRNFHCWNYRREVHKRSGQQSSVEIDYSVEKISENFSNYSAFHHRSIYLKDLISLDSAKANEEEYKAKVTAELSIVENAIFTEPDDQSAWWYLQFLLSYITTFYSSTDGLDLQWFISLLAQQVETCKSLLEIEENSCRWPMVSVILIIEILSSENIRSQFQESMPSECEAYGLLRRSYLEKLQEIDHIHTRRYQYLLKRGNGSA